MGVMHPTAPPRRTPDQRWRLIARIVTWSLFPVQLLFLPLFVNCLFNADPCTARDLELTDRVWIFSGIELLLGLIASHAPLRFELSRRLRPPLVLAQLGAAIVSVWAFIDLGTQPIH
ncbi:hypothetical protein [Streptomyces sp. CAU 1734]|uniref:hypothetical protein n=1 Tax=Streptomyces sp. CAU 1734 TaxID=3140360 RepID=UPI003261A83B